MSEAELEAAVEAVVEEQNERLADWDVDERFEAGVGTHSDGLAIDISKGGEAVFTDAHHFFKAAHEAGYVVSNCKVFNDFGLDKGDHTRLFLHEAEDRGFRDEDDIEEARAEGFVAGLFFAGLMTLLDGDEDDSLYPDDHERRRSRGGKR